MELKFKFKAKGDKKEMKSLAPNMGNIASMIGKKTGMPFKPSGMSGMKPKLGKKKLKLKLPPMMPPMGQ